MSQQRPKKASRKNSIVRSVLFWGVAPLLFFLLGYLVLGPWYSQTGWFRSPAGPPVDSQTEEATGSSEPWYDAASLPDRLGPVGYVPPRQTRARSVRSSGATSDANASSTELSGDNEVIVLPDVPQDVPVYESPFSGEGDVQQSDTVD